MNLIATKRSRIFAGVLLSASMLSMTTAMAANLTVWAWDANFNGATMQQAFDIYQADNPDDTIDIQLFDQAAMEQKLQAQLASGQTTGLPDIVLIEDYRAQKYLLSFPGA